MNTTLSEASTSKRSLEPPSKDQTPKAKFAKKTPSKARDEENIEKESLLKVDNWNKVWYHETLDFLKPEQIRDKDRRKPNDTDYDSRTVYIPQKFILDQTPGDIKLRKCTEFFLPFNCLSL